MAGGVFSCGEDCCEVFFVANITCCEQLKGLTLATSEAERSSCCETFLGAGTEPRLFAV
jgi:hypothetical protein